MSKSILPIDTKLILPERWEKSSGATWIVGERLKNFIPTTLCLQDLEIVKRIGSPSMNGFVYHTKPDIAVKILLINNKYSVDNNNDEIKISKMASKMVLDGVCPFFPIVYGSGICEHTIFPDEDIEKSCKVYQSGDKKLIDMYNNDINVDVSKLPLPSSMVLFSELAHSDLYQYLKVERSPNYKLIIEHVMEGIENLKNAGIRHNDLKLQNILVLVSSNKDIMCLISDFGNSFIEEYEDYSDAICFLKCLIKFGVPDDIRLRIEELINRLNSTI